MDRMVFLSDDETSMCYVEKALCPPRWSQKEGQASLPSSVPQCCHSKKGPGWGWGSRGDLQVLAFPGWPLVDYTKGQPQPACTLPGRCTGHGCCCKAQFNHSAPEDSWRVVEGHSFWRISHRPAPGHTQSPKT